MPLPAPAPWPGPGLAPEAVAAGSCGAPLPDPAGAEPVGAADPVAAADADPPPAVGAARSPAGDGPPHPARAPSSRTAVAVVAAVPPVVRRMNEPPGSSVTTHCIRATRTPEDRNGTAR